MNYKKIFALFRYQEFESNGWTLKVFQLNNFVAKKEKDAKMHELFCLSQSTVCANISLMWLKAQSVRTLFLLRRILLARRRCLTPHHIEHLKSLEKPLLPSAKSKTAASFLGVCTSLPLSRLVKGPYHFQYYLWRDARGCQSEYTVFSLIFPGQYQRCISVNSATAANSVQRALSVIIFLGAVTLMWCENGLFLMEALLRPLKTGNQERIIRRGPVLISLRSFALRVCVCKCADYVAVAAFYFLLITDMVAADIGYYCVFCS